MEATDFSITPAGWLPSRAVFLLSYAIQASLAHGVLLDAASISETLDDSFGYVQNKGGHGQNFLYGVSYNQVKITLTVANLFCFQQGTRTLKTRGKARIAWLCFLAIFSFNLQASSVFEFCASDWAGPNNEWNSRTGGQTLFYDTWGGSAPQKGSSTIAGVAVATAVFDGNDFFTSTFGSGRPWAGLTEFSLSLVFKSNVSALTSETNVNAFWNQRGILGFELGGAGQGEFAIGLYNDGSALGAVAASTGLGTGDNGVSAGNINDNNWHTLTMAVSNLANGSFSQTVYVDGTQVGSSLIRQYGSPGVLADASFSLGAIRGSASSEKFVGEVARLRFDAAPLTGSDITTLHSTYLGAVGIPEPSSSLLMGFGALSLFAMRRRPQRAENK